MSRRSLSQSAASSGLTPDVRDFVFASNTIPPHAANGAPMPASVPSRYVTGEQRVKLAEIAVPDQQVRRYFDPDKLNQLADSIRKHGIVGALLLRPVPSERYDRSFRYELVAGGRRYRAGLLAGVTDAPAIIREMTDADVLELSAIENLQREDLNLFEETEATLQVLSARLATPIESVVALLYQMNNAKKGLNHNVVVSDSAEVVQSTFQELGRLSWDSFVAHRLPLLKLPEDVKEVLQQGRLEYTKAIAISRIKEPAQREELLETAIAGGWSLSQIKDQVRQLKQQATSASTPTMKDRMTETYRRLSRSRVWDDPKKSKRLEQLLTQLDKLMED